MAVENIITDHIDIWTSAIKTRSAAGRGSSKKLDLYGVKKLRELILDLAVCGKLVPQVSNDEPVRKLLKRLADKSSRLVKEGKIKKPKPLPQLEVSDVNFDLPIGWAIAFIPQVVSADKYAIKRGPFGSALKKSYFVPEGIKVYEQQHAIRDDFSIGEYFVSNEKFQELSAFEVKPNDLIISCSGTVGRVAIAPDWMEKGIINQALLKISLNELALTNAYFKILFPAFYMQTETLRDLQGTAQKNMVSVDTLKSEPFPLPSIAEQQRIVAKVDELMALCDQLESQTEASINAHKILVETLLATLTTAKDADELNDSWQRISQHFDVLFTTEASIEQLKQTILQLAVMGKLVKQNPNDEPAAKLLERIAVEKERLVKDKKIKKQKTLPLITEGETPFELPIGWEWVKLGDISLLQGGFAYKSTAFCEESEHQVVRMGNIRPDKFRLEAKSVFIESDLAESTKEYEILSGDILLTMTGTKGKRDYLYSLIVCEDDIATKKLYLNQRLCISRPIFNEPKLVNILFKDDRFLNYIYAKSTGTANQANIGMEAIQNWVLPLPPLNEQKYIVKEVARLIALCDSLKANLKDAQTTQLHLTYAIVESSL